MLPSPTPPYLATGRTPASRRLQKVRFQCRSVHSFRVCVCWGGWLRTKRNFGGKMREPASFGGEMSIHTRKKALF